MKKFWKNFSVMGVVMLALSVVLGVGDLSGAICANGTVADVADAGKQVQLDEKGGALETSDVRDNADRLIKDPVDQKLVKIRPYATPLDTILRYSQAMQTNNLEFDWYSLGTRDVDALVTAVTATSNANKQNVKVELTVDHPELFDVTDTISVPSVTGADGKALVLYVFKKNDSDHLVCSCAEAQMTESAGTYSVPTITPGTEGVACYAMGRAAAELDVLTPGIAYIPEKSHGYCQIFKCQIAQSTYEKIADKEIPFGLDVIEEQALFEFRRRMEGSWLRGVGAKIYDPEKKTYVYTTAGLLNLITNTYEVHAGAADGNGEMVSLSEKIFKGNNGAPVRFALAGSDAMTRISKLKGIERKQDATTTEVVYGITWNKIVTNYGQINMIYYPILNDYGMSDKMIVIDPQFIKKWQVSNLERQVIDGKAHAIMNGEMVVMTEAAGLAVYNPQAHCIVTVSASAS